jgi:hypothetical protein
MLIHVSQAPPLMDVVKWSKLFSSLFVIFVIFFLLLSILLLKTRKREYVPKSDEKLPSRALQPKITILTMCLMAANVYRCVSDVLKSSALKYREPDYLVPALGSHKSSIGRTWSYEIA